LPEPFSVEVVPIASLHPHPRNYRVHPDDEIEHLMQSIREFGVFKNVVVAEDSTLLAGHGVVQAAERLGRKEVPVHRLPIAADSPAALKVLAADNEIAHLVESDDRALSELLKEIKEQDLSGLLGTGYDDAMLANLIYVTRPASEIHAMDEASQWVGMPSYELDAEPWELIVKFDDLEDRAEFAKRLGVTLTDATKSIHFPPQQQDDVASVFITDHVE
jgi:ParB/Sulfiredoxin domain